MGEALPPWRGRWCCDLSNAVVASQEVTGSAGLKRRLVQSAGDPSLTPLEVASPLAHIF
jgi:hypothetical protein